MTIGTTFSLMRLRKKGIFCISPPRVNVSGRVNVMVLDKTGTLTEDGLQVFGFIGSKQLQAAAQPGKPTVEFSRFHELIDYLIPEDLGHTWWFTKQIYQNCKQSLNLKFLEALASCHQITYVHQELIGDPLDVRMFQGTKWYLNEEQVVRENPD